MVPRFVAGALLLGVTCGAVAWAAHQTPGVSGLPFARTTCAPEPLWRMVFPTEGTSVERVGDGWNLWGQGALGAAVCGGGILSITGSGEQAEGAPELTVLLDGELIATETFAHSRTARVILPQGGTVQLAYLNDFYRSEVRLGILVDVRLNTPTCRLLDVSVPAENGGGYSPVPRVATLVGAQPATVLPCQSGQLSFIFAGREARDEYPRLRVEQGGRVLTEVEATARDQRISVQVSAEPVRFRLLNPYAREVADRNLFLRSLRWEQD